LWGNLMSADVGERAVPEQALREADLKYRFLFDHMMNGFAYHKVLFDDQGKPVDYIYLEVNNAFEKMTGLKKEDVVGKRVTELIPGVEHEQANWIEKYGSVVLTGKPISFENYSEGLRRWYSVSAYSPGTPYFATVFEDITERKQAEERERKEHEETSFANRILRLFVEHDGDELFDRALAVVLEGMASKHGVFGYIAEPGHLICPSLSKMLDECEIEGKCIHYPPGKWKGLWARALKEKRSFYTNEAPPVPPGHPIIHNNLAAPILFQGEAIGLLNLANKEGRYNEKDREMLDVIAARMAPVLYAWIQRKLRDDERKKAEEDLRRSERRYRSFVEVTSQWAWVTDPAGLVVEDIPALRKFTGQTYEQAKGVGWADALHPDDVHRTLEVWNRAVSTKTTYETEYRMRRYDGAYRLLLARGVPIVDHQSTVMEWVGTCIDITERKGAEEALRKAHDELEKRVQDRTAELAEMIQRLQGEIHQRKLLETTLRESERQVRLFAAQCLTAQETERKRIASELHDSIAGSLAAIRLRIERMAEKNQRDLGSSDSLQEIASRAAEINIEVRRIMTDLRPSILDDLGIMAAIKWFCREFQKTYSHISVEKQIGIEEREVPETLKTPIFRICQEAMNNCVKHSRGSLVKVSLQKEGERILLTVQDNGWGFNPEKVKKGMGFSNIRERAELSGGVFEVQSGIGEGTTVRVWLPIRVGSVA
jgi:PAS domain S-box-containing protein